VEASETVEIVLRREPRNCSEKVEMGETNMTVLSLFTGIGGMGRAFEAVGDHVMGKR
jgi:hypothetical protein